MLCPVQCFCYSVLLYSFTAGIQFYSCYSVLQLLFSFTTVIQFYNCYSVLQLVFSYDEGATCDYEDLVFDKSVIKNRHGIMRKHASNAGVNFLYLV